MSWNKASHVRSIDERIENYVDLLLRGARGPALAILVIVVFAAMVMAILFQHSDPQSPEIQATAIIDNTRPDDTDRIHHRSSAENMASAQSQSEALRSELSHTKDQLTSSQARITELEAELHQRPGRDDLASAQTQADELRSQLKQGTDQLRSSQVRASELETELHQRPSGDDLASAQRQADELRSELNQATDQIRSLQARITELEAELNQRPSRDDLASAQRQADELRSQLKQATDQLRSSQVRISGLEGELQEHKRVAQLALVNRGDALLGSGDVASARLFYERAAEAGNAEGALRLGETYDPAFFKRARLQGKPDSAQALFWYGRARELGASAADILLKAIQTN
jgi:phage shock protein A